jgi:hypothetical protein
VEAQHSDVKTVVRELHDLADGFRSYQHEGILCAQPVLPDPQMADCTFRPELNSKSVWLDRQRHMQAGKIARKAVDGSFSCTNLSRVDEMV